MKSRTWMWTTAVSLFAALAMPALTAAQDNPSPEHRYKDHQYKLIDLGTLGGPQSIIFGLTRALNNQGVVTGCADTSILDPNIFAGIGGERTKQFPSPEVLAFGGEVSLTGSRFYQ